MQERFIFEFEKLEQWEQTSLLSGLQRIPAFMDAESAESQPLLVAEDLDSPPADTMEPWAAQDDADAVPVDTPPSNGANQI